MIMKHEFVEFLPENLEEKVIYVSVNFGTVAHKCCCGCGNEVYTPLSPTDWKLTFDGESIKLFPAVGNWNFDCKYHYWIRNNQVKWADEWTDEKIREGRFRDQENKKKYYQSEIITSAGHSNEEKDNNSDGLRTKGKSSYWDWLKNLFSN